MKTSKFLISCFDFLIGIAFIPTIPITAATIVSNETPAVSFQSVKTMGVIMVDPVPVSKEDIITIDQIDWSTVTEAIISYDDGTTLPASLQEYIVLSNAKFQIRPYGGVMNAAYVSAVARGVWVKRADGWTLSLTMKFSSYSGADIYAGIWGYHGYEPQWSYKNKSSMANQFYCHRDVVGSYKNPWNIEPWKSDKGYWGFVFAACN